VSTVVGKLLANDCVHNYQSHVSTRLPPEQLLRVPLNPRNCFFLLAQSLIPDRPPQVFNRFLLANR
jgi:hypothetical protein